ncbi:hypothetical protein Aau02nite_90070 [Amorphoplanes auranticolor]|uniref:S-(Hydroxymethyl)glutathione dehydrogenase/alcohol dehydrogenase n=2 Tax=Actinoplanes auranticolor TaxID=47988 RepID=A0A919VV98_9ACTN|nr:hypothetical protein Aau02nite_90070 [Actinoplanes auranticolor]
MWARAARSRWSATARSDCARGAALPIKKMFADNIAVAGGVAPVRPYLPGLLSDVLAGSLDASAVFDLQLPMEKVAEAYAAMDERRSIKTLLWP